MRTKFKDSVSQAETGSRGEHASSDVHCHELLEEQLGGVRDLDLRDARLVVAGTALILALLDLPVTLVSKRFNVLK